MCDYCDCRQQEPIAELSAEHERLLALAATIRTTLRRGDDGRASALLDDLLAILGPHARREELGLFTALAGDDDLAATVPLLLAEHASLHRPADRSPAALTAFLDALAAHIDREEHDVFPAAAQLLPAASWEVVAALSGPSGS